MNLRIVALVALLLSSSAIADDDASRAKLMGTWQVADAAKEPIVWTFQEKGEGLHVVNSSGTHPIAEFDCDYYGHDCAIKDAGRPAKVSLYFNGPKLVEYETKGSSVWKRTFTITGDGDAMEMEQSQIAPVAKTETVRFKRLPAANTAH